MIEVNNLIYEYPEKRVLNNLTFRIESGSITALIGRNGAGKTTLLECLAGLRKPLSGDIRIDGISIIEFPRKCNNIIGFLPTFYGLYDELSVEKCLLYVALSHNMNKEQAKAHTIEICEKLHLSDYQHEKAGNLSRGVRQRLVLAQALIHKPKFLLLEKPSTGLDYDSRIALREYLTELNKNGVTILIATHVLDELELFATHCMVLEKGSIIEHCELTVNQNVHATDFFRKYLNFHS